MAFLQPTFTGSEAPSIAPFYETDPFLTGLEYTWLSATTFSISPGAARAYNSGTVMVSNQTITVDLTTIGLNGCYPLAASVAAPTNDTVMGVYLIGDATGVLGAQQAGSPKVIVATGDNFLPTGYQSWRRIGSVFIDAGTNNQFYLRQTGSGLDRRYELDSAYIALAAGAATSFTAVNFSNSNGPCNPSFVSELLIQLVFTPSLAAHAASLSPTNVVTSTDPIVVKGQVDNVPLRSNASVVPRLLNASTSIYYAVTNSGDALSLRLYGWSESLGLQAV